MKNVNYKSKYLEYLFLFLILAFCFCLLFTKNYSSIVLDGTKLYFAIVFPSLFPFMFFSFILSNLNATRKFSTFFAPLTTRLFKTSGITAFAFFMSIISGYPVGAKVISELKQNNLISNTDAIKGSTFCSTSSPVFLISSVGGIMFSSTDFGIKLFFIHTLSTIITGFIFSYYKRKEKIIKPASFKPVNSDNLLYSGSLSAVTNVLTVGGLIVIFYLVINLIINTFVFKQITSFVSPMFLTTNNATGFFASLLELTSGLKILSQNPNFLTLPLCAFLVSFGGLCIICQSIAFLKNAKIKTAPFVFSKLISAVLSFILALICNLIFF